MPGICSSRFNIVSQCWNMYMLIRNRLLMSTATEIPSRFRHFVMIMTQVVALKINVSFNVICSSLNVCFWYWIRIGYFQECFLLPVNLRFFSLSNNPTFSLSEAGCLQPWSLAHPRVGRSFSWSSRQGPRRTQGKGRASCLCRLVQRGRWTTGK